jgi:hypothetical protein
MSARKTPWGACTRASMVGVVQGPKDLQSIPSSALTGPKARISRRQRPRGINYSRSHPWHLRAPSGTSVDRKIIYKPLCKFARGLTRRSCRESGLHSLYGSENSNCQKTKLLYQGPLQYGGTAGQGRGRGGRPRAGPGGLSETLGGLG